MSEVYGYYLTKVTKRRFAERLLDGELYLSSLAHFGEVLHRPEDANTASLILTSSAVEPSLHGSSVDAGNAATTPEPSAAAGLHQSQ